MNLSEGRGCFARPSLVRGLKKSFGCPSKFGVWSRKPTLRSSCYGSMWWGKEAAVEAISGAARGFAAGQFTGGQRVLLAAIPIEQLHPNPQQPRRFIDPESLAELTESVRQRGVLQPIIVKLADAGYLIMAR